MAPFICQSNQVFFDINMGGGGQRAKRITMELYAEEVSETVKNFRALCTGKPPHYKGATFHRTKQGVMCQGGAFTVGNGPGGKSIHGSGLVDVQCKPGCLSMPKDGPGSNGSQFLIWTAEPDALVLKHVVFGQIFRGKDIVEKLGKKSARTLKAVFVSNCGDPS